MIEVQALHKKSIENMQQNCSRWKANPIGP